MDDKYYVVSDMSEEYWNSKKRLEMLSAWGKAKLNRKKVLFALKLAISDRIKYIHLYQDGKVRNVWVNENCEKFKATLKIG